MKLMNSDKKVVSNTMWSFLGKIFAMVFLIVFDATVARMLSVEGYAEWVFFFAILTMLFYVGWLGINTSLKVYISKCSTSLEKNNCIKAALILRIIVSLVIGLGIFFILPQFAIFLGYPHKYPTLKELLKISAVLVVCNSFTEFYKEMCIGLQKFKNLFWITVVEYAGYLVYSVIALCIWNNVRAIAWGYMLSGISVTLLGIWTIKNAAEFQLSNTDAGYKKKIYEIFKYAIPIAVISFGGLILIEMDTFMLGLLSEKAEVAVYSIAKNLCSKATHVNYALTVGTMTAFSRITKENVEEKYKHFNKISNINLIITFGIGVAFMLLSGIAINILYGAEYEKASDVIRMLVPYYMLYSISNFFSSFLDFRGKAHFRSLCYISIIVINLVLNILLIPRWGAVGAAMATDISLLPYTIIVIIATYNHFAKLRKESEIEDESSR